jgi:multiple sugar transport system ATP-binding protein
VTHDQAEAMTMSDRVAVMMDGELLQVDTPAAVYDDPAHLRVASFISNPGINVMPGSIRSDGAVETLGAVLPMASPPDLSPGAAVQVVWRPEGADLCDPGTGTLAGQVVRYERLGAEIFVHVANPALREPATVRLDAGDEESNGRVAPGQTVGIKLRVRKILLFRQDGTRIRTDLGRAAA